MASTFTGDLRLELMAAGEKPDTWGDVLNASVFQLIEDALTAETTVSTTGGTTTLTTNSGSTDTSRSVFIDVSGTLVSNSIVEIPAANKFYLIRNGTAGAFTVTIKTSAGSGTAITQGDTAIVYCDATNTFAIGQGSFDISTFARTILDDTSASAVRTTLGLVIGTDVLPELAVVSQAVAEAGTDTAEYIWTAQRVQQAIAALSAGAGDLSGPASSTDLSIALFDSTTGKLLQDGPALGTSGHVLTSGGAGVAPAFAAPASATAIGLTSMQVFTASGTWTKPTGVTKVLIYVVGAGGGGSAGSSVVVGNGGGGGSTGHSLLDVSAIATSTLTIGAGGGGGAYPSGTGTTGGLSRWSDGTNTITGAGGGGATSASIGAGGTATGGTLNIKGIQGAGQYGGASGMGFGGGSSSSYGGGGTGGAIGGGGNSGTGGLVVVYEYV